MSDMAVDVSVIIPVYNTEKYLRECMESIIKQTIFECMEVILIDDGSTDNSPAICDEYDLQYKNIHVIHQKNAGVSAARNAGMGEAIGEYIGFADSDDYIYPEMFEKLLETAEKTNAGMSFCEIVQCLPDGEIIIHYPFPEEEPLSKDYIQNTIYPYIMKNETLNACWNKLFKRSIIADKNIKFILGRKIGEDRRFMVDFLACCNHVCYTPYAGYYYRLVPTSAIQTPRTDCLENYIFQYYEDFELFEPLGVDRKLIEANSGQKLLEQTLTGIHFYENKLAGTVRDQAIWSFVNNQEIRQCLNTQWDRIRKECSTYEKMLFFMIKMKSVQGLRCVMAAMKLKNSLVRCKSR